MSIMLPDWLEWVLNEMLGMDWPTADEDKLIESAQHWRQFATEVQQIQYAGVTSAGNVVSENYGDSIDGFKGTWDKFSGNGSGYLDDAQTVALVVAGVLDAAAGIVIAAKVAVIAQLAILAAEIIAAQAAAPFTFGLSELTVAAATQATRLIVRRLLKELKDALIEAVVEAMKEPAISALEAMITDLITQSLNVNFGAQKSIDLGQTVKTGADAAVDQLKNTPQTIAEGLRDGLGERAGRHVHNAAGHGSDGDGEDGSNSNSNSSSAGGDGGADSSSSSNSSASPNGNTNSNASPNTNTSASPNSTSGNNGSSNSPNSSGTTTPDSTPTTIPVPDNAPASSDSNPSPLSSTTPDSSPVPTPAVASTSDGYTPSPFDPPVSTDTSPSVNTDTGTDTGTGTNTPSNGGPTTTTTTTTPGPDNGTASSPMPRTSTSEPFSGPNPTSYTPSPHSTTPDSSSVRTVSDSFTGPDLSQTYTPTHQPADLGATNHASQSPNSGMPSSPNLDSAGPASSRPATAGTSTPTTPSSSNPVTSPNVSTAATASPSSTSAPTRTPGPASNPVTSPSPTGGSNTGTSTPSRSTTPPSTSPSTTPGTSPSPSTPSGNTSPRATPSTITTTTSATTTPAATPTPTSTSTPTSTPSTSPSASPSPSSTPSTNTSPRTGSNSNSNSNPASGTTAPANPTAAPSRNVPPGPAPTPGTPQTPAQQSPDRPAADVGNRQQPPTSQPSSPTTPTTPSPQSPTGSNPQSQHSVPPPVHLHASIPAQNTGHPQQSQPGSTPQAPLRPASDSRPYGQPGGVEGPRPDVQANLESIVPRDDNGDPVRHPDPNDGPWTENINGTDPSEPGRNNNCADTALSTVDTYSGNPTAAASRTPDVDSDGNPSDRGETGGRDRIENTLGAKFSDMGNGKDAFTNLESTLRDSGHGSQAVIITSDANGRAHAWNAVNHNGVITYIDAQTGQRSNTPLHNGDNGVFAIPLNPDRRPVTPSSPTTGPGSNRPADSRPVTTAPAGDRRPAAEPGHSPNPDGMDVDESDGDHDHDMADPDDADAMDDVPDAEDDEPSHVSEPEGPDSEQLGLPPDPTQAVLRESHDVHRVDLDRVHQRLDAWAADGSLAGVMQDAVGAANGPNLGQEGRTTFTKSELSDRLPGFDQLSQGEQLAAISAMGRLSSGFHSQHGVGSSPESVAHPYRGASDPAADPGTTDSAAKNSTGSLGAKAHKTTGDNFLAAEKAEVVNDSDHVWDHGPDFTDRNYAVIEMTGPDGETHYVVDSSVPPGEKDVSPRHSEKHLLDWMDRVNEGKAADQQYTPTGLYTEREPCGEGAGHAKCSQQLSDRLATDVPVYYSTTYRTDPADVEAGKAIDAEKAKIVKASKSLPIAEVRKQLQQRTEARYGPNSGRAKTLPAKLAGMNDAEARKALNSAINSDFKKAKEETRSDNVVAMGNEMGDHVAALKSTWEKMGSQLL